MSRLQLLAGAVLCVAVGCESKTKTAPERLQGQWQMRESWGSYEFGLPEAKKNESLGGVLWFAGDNFTFLNGTRAGHQVTGTFACDTSVSPPRIAFRFNRQAVVCIYSLDDGKLRVCVGEDDNVPPQHFVLGGKRGKSRPTLLVFQRPTKTDD
jgi:uncharacterized protein (TIGR03067 family)